MLEFKKTKLRMEKVEKKSLPIMLLQLLKRSILRFRPFANLFIKWGRTKLLRFIGIVEKMHLKLQSYYKFLNIVYL
jgi:hypothetical protein